jgi:hypothetical protein
MDIITNGVLLTVLKLIGNAGKVKIFNYHLTWAKVVRFIPSA